MSLRTKEYFIRESILSIRRNRLMSIASISTVTISLLILGIFALMTVNINNLANILESQVQVTVYIKDGTSKEGTAILGGEIKKLPGVAKVDFVGKEEALKRFAERLGERTELLDSLGDDNPLPDAFEVHMDRPEQVKAAVSRIGQLEGVEKTVFGQESIEQLFALTRILRVGGAVLIIFLALATLFIISNTIRITVFSRRREVNIMKYVGATDWFIRWPFLLEGMLLGLAGSFLAVVLLTWLYGMIVDQIHASLPFLPLVPRSPLLYYTSGFLVVAGMGIGALGSNISLRKFLQV
jgi:cell division transport system permease protein